MGWRDFVGQSPDALVAPWLGGSRLYRDARQWRIDGALPAELGWYRWQLNGRRAVNPQPVEADPSYGESWPTDRGYLIGDRFVSQTARVDPDPDKLVAQTQPVYLAEPGLDRFTPVQVLFDPIGRAIFAQELFPEGAEDAVRRAYVDRKLSLDDIPAVTPALDLAFRFVSWRRLVAEERRAELERQRAEAERQRAEAERQRLLAEREREAQAEAARREHELVRSMETAAGRRHIAALDFEAAAAAALSVGGALLLDVRSGRRRREAVVQFRFHGRRFECVADRRTLQIIDAGICLTDEETAERGDSYFTLESLPGVIRQAIEENVLVVYRHVDG
jgi:hypothetical protein